MYFIISKIQWLNSKVGIRIVSGNEVQSVVHRQTWTESKSSRRKHENNEIPKLFVTITVDLTCAYCHLVQHRPKNKNAS